MKYSIIIPYRDRKSHLEVLLPRLHEIFKQKEYEIIVSEQDDSENFSLSNTQNVGVMKSTGDVIVLHQVDYIPTDDVSYDIESDPILPAHNVIFLNENFEERNFNDIPPGYRHFLDRIDDNFYGGVVVMKRVHWDSINGLNPMYKGWGNEDEDLRERLKWIGCNPKRNHKGTFLCLYHRDNGNMENKTEKQRADFIEGRKILSEAWKYRDIGYKNLKYDIEEFKVDIENVRWLKSRNYQLI